MKVTIEHAKKKVSLFKSADVIILGVLLSDEEEAIIKKMKFEDYIFHEPPIHNHFAERMQGPAYVKNLFGLWPITFHYDNPQIAHQDAIKIKEDLSTLKEMLDNAMISGPPPTSESFEL